MSNDENVFASDCAVDQQAGEADTPRRRFRRMCVALGARRTFSAQLCPGEAHQSTHTACEHLVITVPCCRWLPLLGVVEHDVGTNRFRDAYGVDDVIQLSFTLRHDNGNLATSKRNATEPTQPSRSDIHKKIRHVAR
jgi:hypothetical protein